jgi:hypothetical protein
MSWTYSNMEQTVAHRTTENGAYESMLVASLPPSTVVTAFVSPPPLVPKSVTRFQALAALDDAGLTPSIEAYMTSTASLRTRRAWQEAQTFERDSSTVVALAALLGLTSSQTDALFMAAKDITA